MYLLHCYPLTPEDVHSSNLLPDTFGGASKFLSRMYIWFSVSFDEIWAICPLVIKNCPVVNPQKGLDQVYPKFPSP
jgi:hypothetical protein